MTDITRYLHKRIRRLSEQFAEDMAVCLTQKIENDFARVSQAFEIAASAFASAISDSPTPDEDEDAAPVIPLPRSSRRASPNGERQNTCRKCGMPGFTAKTCGRTHNVAASSTPEEGEEDAEPESEPEPDPAPAPAPRPPPDRPSFRSPGLPTSPVVPKKVVQREKALKEIRLERLRRLQDIKEDKAAKAARKIAPPEDEDEEWDTTGPSEGDAVKLNAAQID